MVENGDDQARLGMEALAGAAAHFDAESFIAADTTASTITQIMRDASQPNAASILRAVDRERVQNGKLPASDLDRGGLSREQRNQANEQQRQRDAEKRQTPRDGRQYNGLYGN